MGESFMKWETVIGLEVHAQLKTQSKLFSGSANGHSVTPNSQTSFIDAGFPGVLPVVNESAIILAIRFGLAIDAQINNLSFFERKNYFYPDLPKGYQISQYQRPLISNGHLEINLDNVKKDIIITRAHLEEDAGKSVHNINNNSGIDFNRSGIPLLEIVTSPCMHSAAEAIAYLKNLHQLVRFIDICDGNMQEGSFRCDVNLSLRPIGESKLGIRTELKNLNSFRFIEKAILYEEKRHHEILDRGGELHQETRLFNPDTEATYVMRSKENENDYRYFPDPDLLPIVINKEIISNIRNNMPPLPKEIKSQLEQQGATEDEIQFLLSSPSHINYFHAIKNQSHVEIKLILNWLRGSYSSALNAAHLNFDHILIAPNVFAHFLNAIADQKINSTIAKKIFAELLTGKINLDELIHENAENIITDDQIIPLIQSILAKYPEQQSQYLAGKEKLLAFFVGKVMQELQGKADPVHINDLFRKALKK